MKDCNGSHPEARYYQQAKHAKQRGIAWEMTFDEWMQVWNDSGKFHLRGQGIGKYVMARFGDKGPYHKDNVYICLHSQNIKDAYKNKKWVAILGKGKGWHFDRKHKTHPYVTNVCGKVIGRYQTQAEAEAVYKERTAIEIQKVLSQ